MSYPKIERPNIALITNHGYAGVNIPFGGAPDTGGQNVYVNAYAEALDRLGYKVTIYARGGFPFYESGKVREGEEYLSENVRYIYVPGGGEEFIRKEDISIALIEEVNWIYEHIEQEAASVGILPWDFYEMINSHYWDAGVIGVSLIVKWQNDLTARMIELLCKGVVDEKTMAEFKLKRHYHSISKAPGYSLGKLLLDSMGDNGYVYQEEIMSAAFDKWSKNSPLAQQMDLGLGRHIDWQHMRSTVAASTKQLRPLVLSKVLGSAVLDQQVHPALFDNRDFRKYRTYQEIETFGDILQNALKRINVHVWTPHSLGVIKEWNFKDKSDDVNRDLKFRERRSHERMICDYTPALGATSYEIAESLIANYGAEIDDVLFFPPGVDIKIYHKYSNGDIKALHRFLAEKTGLSAEKLVSSTIIYEASRMDVTKRKDVILEAFHQVVQSGVEDCILLIGGGPENAVFNDLKDLLNSFPKIKDKAFLLGFVEDEFMPLLFSRCDIYVSASEMEGFGMSVCQAAVDGKPIVSSDKIPFTTYYLANEAYIIPAGDVDGFSEAILKLIHDEADRQDRGKRSQEKAMGLEWEHLTTKFLFDLNKKQFDIPLTVNVLELD